jgi:hypothetical protein
MATLTIPMLPQATGLVGDEQIECVQGGSSVRTTAAAIAAISPANAGAFLTAQLPVPTVAGLRFVVLDSLTNNFGDTLVGGGTYIVPVYSTGSQWLLG